MGYGNSSGHYARNPEYYRERNRARKAEVMDYVRQYKEQHPCDDCGVFYPHYVMQFDHLSGKTANVSDLAKRTTLPRVIREIEKCELVCANCHAERTYQRANHAAVA